MKFRTSIRLSRQKLKCYEKEIAKYKHLYYALIDTSEAVKLIKLIRTKFKIKVKGVDFDCPSNSPYGGMAYQDGTISFKSKRLNIYIVCHELTHLTGIDGHPRKFFKKEDEIIKYVSERLDFNMRILKKK